ncbi:MAG: heme ABC transporter permease [Sphingomonadales bacterium]
MHRFANPARFNKIADAISPYLFGATVILFGLGIYYALFNSPADFQQGETVRIMYVHVPASYMATGAYMFLALASATFLIWKHPLAGMAAKAAAPIGLVFTALALFTGAFWGKPMWGDWWVWDGRLTSVLVLFFLYLGYIALWQVMEDRGKAAKASSVLALVGVINLPIIKFSVDWWTTLHQPASIFRLEGPTIDGSMLIPLFLMMGAYTFFFATVLIWRIKAEMAERKLETLLREKAS